MACKTRIAVLVSGGGTNLQAILDAQAAGHIPHGEVVLVVSNRTGAYALERAKAAGVPTLTLTRKACGGQAGFEAALAEALAEAGTELIVLAGFLAILSQEFTDRWPRRILNVHPSLIPAFCGEGFYGLKVHEAALARGVKVTGATAYFADGDGGVGGIILQKAIDVLPDDTPESLGQRVMEECEWKLLSRAVALYCGGKLSVHGKRVIVKE